MICTYPGQSNRSGWPSPAAIGATGERLFYQPTALELASVHATNFGVGMRFNFVRWADLMPNTYAFVEASRRESTNPLLDGWRAFGGMLVQY